MKKFVFVVMFLFYLIFPSCKKEGNNTNDCFSNDITSRQIVEKQATVKQQADGVFFIVEQGTIDTRLFPCNLPTEFQSNNL